MPEYTYPNDGRLHTRYSELVRCTQGQIDRVVAEHFGESAHFSSGHTGFGSERHSMYEEEMRESGVLPSCFAEVCPEFRDVPISMVEQELRAEVLPRIVLHSTPDAVSRDGYIFDFKVTTQQAKKYRASKQLKVYAYQLSLRDIDIHTAVFLIERWDSGKTRILGYDCARAGMGREDLLEARDWVRDRARLLERAIEIHKGAK